MCMFVYVVGYNDVIMVILIEWTKGHYECTLVYARAAAKYKINIKCELNLNMKCGRMNHTQTYTHIQRDGKMVKRQRKCGNKLKQQEQYAVVVVATETETTAFAIADTSKCLATQSISTLDGDSHTVARACTQ